MRTLTVDPDRVYWFYVNETLRKTQWDRPDCFSTNEAWFRLIGIQDGRDGPASARVKVAPR